MEKFSFFHNCYFSLSLLQLHRIDMNAKNNKVHCRITIRKMSLLMQIWVFNFPILFVFSMKYNSCVQIEYSLYIR